MNNPEKKSIPKRIWYMMLAVGPGIFAIGYTIGTGSVTSMAKAGSEFGTQLMWVLALSVLFSWVMMEAYGRYAVVTLVSKKFGQPPKHIGDEQRAENDHDRRYRDHLAA